MKIPRGILRAIDFSNIHDYDWTEDCIFCLLASLPPFVLHATSNRRFIFFPSIQPLPCFEIRTIETRRVVVTRWCFNEFATIEQWRSVKFVYSYLLQHGPLNYRKRNSAVHAVAEKIWKHELHVLSFEIEGVAWRERGRVGSLFRSSGFQERGIQIRRVCPFAVGCGGY